MVQLHLHWHIVTVQLHEALAHHFRVGMEHFGEVVLTFGLHTCRSDYEKHRSTDVVHNITRSMYVGD
jgi:hypothetical protein